MPFADVESFLGAPAEYDIPVMPRQLPIAGGSRTVTSLGGGHETLRLAKASSTLNRSRFIMIMVSDLKALKVPRHFDYRRVKCSVI